MNRSPLKRPRSAAASVLILGAVLSSAPAAAVAAEKADRSSRILIAAHPCNIAMAEPAEEKVLAARCALAVAKIPWADLLGSDEVRAWLRKEKRSNCNADASCLAKMSEDLRSNLAMFITVGARHPRGIYLRVMLVKPYSDPEHRVAKDEEWYLPRPAKFTAEAVAGLVEQQIQRLPRPADRDVAPIPLVQPPPVTSSGPPNAAGTAPGKPAAPAPSVAPVPPPASAEGPSPVPGFVVGGAGLVTAGVGVWLLASARGDWDQFMAYYQNGNIPAYEQKDEVVGLYNSAQGKQYGGLAALIGGGAAMAAGGIMVAIALSEPAPSAQHPAPAALKVSVGPGSWTVALEGRWP